MSCQIHKQRKRPNKCEECKKDLEVLQEKEVLVENAPKPVKVKEPEPVKILVDAQKELKKIEEDAKQILLGFQVKMDALIEKGVSKLNCEYGKLVNIKYEYLYIDEAKFRVEMIDKESVKGWRFVAFVDEKLAKTYMRDRGFALFERVKK
jgi:hypothetical protein